MLLSLNLQNYTASKGSKGGANVVNSPEALGETCTLTQLNRLADNYLGKRFERGTKKNDACEALYTAMVKAVAGGKGTKEEKPKTKPAVDKGANSKAREKSKKTDTQKKTGTEKSVGRGGKYNIYPGKINDKDHQALKDIKKVINDMCGRKKVVQDVDRMDIMNQAIEKGEFDYSKSSQKPEKMFSWWCRFLKRDGFIEKA